jgi:peptide deformylase
MPVQRLVSKSDLSLFPARPVTNFLDKYVKQSVRDLLDTLTAQQAELDKEFPGEGRGVGLSANMIEYPYEPASQTNFTPKEGFYPENFIPFNIYVISIRKARAEAENCSVVNPSVYINAELDRFYTASEIDDDSLMESDVLSLSLTTSDEEIVPDTFYDEACLSLAGFSGFEVPRYKNIAVSARDENGGNIQIKATDFIAIVHQHQIDHGEGKEFLDHLKLDGRELSGALRWINDFAADKRASKWVVDGKLQCVSKTPDVESLRAWVLHTMKKYNISPDAIYLSRVHTDLAFFRSTGSPVSASIGSPMSTTSSVNEVASPGSIEEHKSAGLNNSGQS